jgi:hypothetical protein
LGIHRPSRTTGLPCGGGMRSMRSGADEATTASCLHSPGRALARVVPPGHGSLVAVDHAVAIPARSRPFTWPGLPRGIPFPHSTPLRDHGTVARRRLLLPFARRRQRTPESGSSSRGATLTGSASSEMTRRVHVEPDHAATRSCSGRRALSRRPRPTGQRNRFVPNVVGRGSAAAAVRGRPRARTHNNRSVSRLSRRRKRGERRFASTPPSRRFGSLSATRWPTSSAFPSAPITSCT